MHLSCVHLFSFILFHQEEEAALKHRDRLEQEKRCLIRELKRCRDEDASPFNHFPILNKRYALLNLLGKGGFSEVFKVYPLTLYHLSSSFQYNTSMPRSFLSFFRHVIFYILLNLYIEKHCRRIFIEHQMREMSLGESENSS